MRESFELHNLFNGDRSSVELPAATFQRSEVTVRPGMKVISDRFERAASECIFLRYQPNMDLTLSISTTGGYSAHSPAAGGWLLTPSDIEQDTYWIPQPPMLRRLDSQGHILSYKTGAISEFNSSASSLEITLVVPSEQFFDLVIWRICPEEKELASSLVQMASLENQGYFLWSSHTAYSRPADLYLHLVYGYVYENHEVWPKYWRVCSELDAYALYVTLTGLLRATGKRLYHLLRTQVVFSVIARQAEDGGWYHGEWTDHMESHYRLHAGGMHMLAAFYEETQDPTVRKALRKAANFAASRTDRLRVGVWYLHDSLEENVKSLEKYPFRYAPSRVLGKTESNLLVLNTHLDTNIAMERYRRVSGDRQYDNIISSARASTRAVLSLKPADWLYRPLYKAINLTFLPSQQGAALPLPLRALKRIAWKYLVPKLPHIKARFPRFVMPGGFIERGLSQYGLSVRYQPVNLMDLIRTRRLFGETALDSLLEESFRLTQQSGIKDRWKEFRGKEDDSLGFWAEALYHLCLAKQDMIYRSWLAEVIIDLEDNGLGLPPSLLGGNAEAVAPDQQRPCPSASDTRFRVVNLSRGAQVELLLVNPQHLSIDLDWESAPSGTMTWTAGGDTMPLQAENIQIIPPRTWVHGKAKSLTALHQTTSDLEVSAAL